MDVFNQAFTFLMVALGGGIFLFCISIPILSNVKNENLAWAIRGALVLIWMVVSFAVGFQN